MPGRSVRERVADQFSYRGEGADVWRAFDRLFETDEYLNLGYSPWYLPHFVGASQRRLADVLGRGLARRLGGTTGVRLLDVGCGRGGPAAVLADAYGFAVTGVDLVPYNVRAARENATRAGVSTAFVLGDATTLPVATDAVGAAASIDALVYVPEARSAFEELARVLQPGGVLAVSDLLAADAVDGDAADAVDAFAEAWDMPEVLPRDRRLDDLAAAGLAIDGARDLSPHSVGRFRKWTRLYLAVADRRPALLDRALGRWDVDAGRVTERVRAAHEALPHLRHVLVYARKE